MDEIAAGEPKQPCSLQCLAHVIADLRDDIDRLRFQVMWLFRRLQTHEPDIQPEIAAVTEAWEDEHVGELNRRMSYDGVCRIFRIPREEGDG